MRPRFASRLLTAAALALWSGGLSAHEGHVHEATPALADISAAPRAEAASELFELVAVARSGELVIYLDRFASNEPVSDATVEVETPAGSVAARRDEAGRYSIPAPWSTEPGRYDLIFSIASDGGADVLPVTLETPAPPAEPSRPAAWLTSSAFANGIKDRIAANDPALVTAAATGFFAGMAVMGLMRRRRRRAVAVCVIAGAVALGAAAPDAHAGSAPASLRASAAEDRAQRLPDGSVFVPKATQRILGVRTAITAPAVHRRTVELPGRVIPDPNASGYVQASVGGRLSAPPGGFPRLGARVSQGDVLAFVTPPLQAIDISDMRQRQGELDQQISIVERRLARYQQLAPSGAVARSQLEETRLELEGLKERRAALDKVRREPEALLAPVDGVIAEGTPVAGQIVSTSAVVFHIVDPARLWVEALSYEPLAPPPQASARIGERSFRLSYRGAGFADRNPAFPIHFAIEEDVAGLRAGQLLTVLAATEDERRGLAAPRASLVRGANGQDLVYEHVSAERFEARPVRIEPLDGDRVLIAAGVSAGSRIVTQGAELLHQIR